MPAPESAPALDLVTGAFSNTGKYVAERLLARGRRVRTLTGHPGHPHPFGDRIQAFPYDFDRPERLRETLRGVDTVYNTYWVRFEYGDRTYARAVENVKTLIRTAEEAGVRRLVHVSIANPSVDSPFPYYRGKWAMEEALRASRLSWAILRPTVIFGPDDILINNIAWCLRHFPVFGVPGDGSYGMQPIFIEELADLLVAAGAATENAVADAVGPEVFTFDAWLRAIAAAIGVRARLVHLPPRLAWLATKAIDPWVGDVLLTWEEVGGLRAGLLASKAPPLGRVRLTDWLERHAAQVGVKYASELARHFR
ncbi:MAG: NAD(P)H-binding protein [Planctomycetes bacterium]|nr:NAD(P)H-binding protein [Planctomycetota bacterium]